MVHSSHGGPTILKNLYLSILKRKKKRKKETRLIHLADPRSRFLGQETTKRKKKENVLSKQDVSRRGKSQLPVSCSCGGHTETGSSWLPYRVTCEHLVYLIKNELRTISLHDTEKKELYDKDFSNKNGN